MKATKRANKKLWTACAWASLVGVGLGADLARADLPDTVARIKPSVVLVGTFSETDNPRFTFRGTGFVVETGNWVVTNVHVLPDSPLSELGKKLAVQVWSGPNRWAMRQAKVLALDRAHDLSLLIIDGPSVPALKISASVPREGSAVAFTGFPIGGALGFSHVTHRATLSAITAIALPSANSQQLNERAIRQLRGGSFDIFRFDGTAYPGNSGGPVFDPETGEVLAVINSVLVKGSRETALSQPSGISYGIPAEYVRRLLQDSKGIEK